MTQVLLHSSMVVRQRSCLHRTFPRTFSRHLELGITEPLLSLRAARLRAGLIPLPLLLLPHSRLRPVIRLRFSSPLVLRPAASPHLPLVQGTQFSTNSLPRSLGITKPLLHPLLAQLRKERFSLPSPPILLPLRLKLSPSAALIPSLRPLAIRRTGLPGLLLAHHDRSSNHPQPNSASATE